MKKKTIYYAHPTDTWKAGAKLKHLELAIELALKGRGYDVINPFDKEKELNEKYNVSEYYDEPTLPHAREIRNQDYKYVENCDAFFCWFPKGITAIGTGRELEHAIKHKKYIIVLTYQPHPFLWSISDIDELYLSTESFLKKQPFWKKEEK